MFELIFLFQNDYLVRNVVCFLQIFVMFELRILFQNDYSMGNVVF